MPLSEEEQRILKQIEEQFYESDPSFAEKVSAPGLYRPALRRARWAVAGLVAALIGLVLSLQVHFLASFAFFIAMLLCAFVIEDSLRSVGRAGLNGVRNAPGGLRRFRPRSRSGE